MTPVPSPRAIERALAHSGELTNAIVLRVERNQPKGWLVTFAERREDNNQRVQGLVFTTERDGSLWATF